MRKDSMSREVLRHEEFEGCVEIKRVRDWFICVSIISSPKSAVADLRKVNVESEGPYAPERLLPEAVKVMRSKIASIKMAAQALISDSGADDGGSVAAHGDADMEMKDS